MNTNGYDTALQSNISLQNHFPLVTISDSVTHKQVARIVYRMENAILETCQESKTILCNTPKTQPTIRLITPATTDLMMASAGGVLSLNSSSANILNINKNGSIAAIPRLSFVPKNTGTLGLEIGVMLDNTEIAKLVYIMDSTLSVERAATLEESSQKNTPVILSTGFSIAQTPGNPLYPSAFGYKIFSLTSNQELDDTKNGPEHSDSIGAISEISGVGWQ